MSSTTTTKMESLVKQREEIGYDLVQQDIPIPKEGELLVKCIKSSICGSDINLYLWNDRMCVFAKSHRCSQSVFV